MSRWDNAASTAGQFVLLMSNGNTGKPQFYATYNPTFYNSGAGATSLVAGKRHIVTGVANSSRAAVWLDGVEGSAQSNSISLSSSTYPVVVSNSATGSYQFSGRISLVLLHARALSDAEIKEVHRAPFSLFVPRRSKIYIVGASSGSSSAAGSSTLTFAASGTTSATKRASGSSSLTFAASAAGTSSTVAVGSSSITFAATGATAATKQAAGSSSLTFGVSAVSTATPTTASADAGGGHSPQRRKRRYILPDDTEVYATDIEIRDILREFVKPKPQKTKKKAARVIPLEARVEFVEEPTKKAERIVVKQQIAVWQPDDTLYQQMVARLVVQQRRRKTVEFLLLAA